MKRNVIWHVCFALLYLAVAYVVMSVSKSRFETLVLAVLIWIYTASQHNFSIIGSTTDVNNYAGFVRFRILAAAQGVTEDEEGLFVDQEKTLREHLEDNAKLILINRISHSIVSIFALYKIFAVLLSA